MLHIAGFSLLFVAQRLARSVTRSVTGKTALVSSQVAGMTHAWAVLTFSLREPDVVSHEVWDVVVHLIHKLEDIVDEEDGVIIAKDEPLVVLRAHCEVAEEGSSRSPGGGMHFQVSVRNTPRASMHHQNLIPPIDTFQADLTRTTPA